MEKTKKLQVEEVLRWTPLRFAEETGAWEWVERLLQAGVPWRSLEATRRQLRDPRAAAAVLRAACSAGHVQLLRLALAAEPSLCALPLDAAGSTPLHVAASSRRAAAVRALLQAGADPSARDLRGRTPLHAAALYDHMETVRMLLDAGAEVLAVDEDNKNAIEIACDSGHHLMARSLGFISGSIPSHAFRMMFALEAGNIEMVRDLLPVARPPMPNGWSMVHWATIRGSVSVLRTLLASGLDPNVCDAHGNTPLHITAARGQPDLAVSLIQGGAHVDVADSTGSTALHYAVRTGNLPLVRLLLEAGARCNLHDKDGDTPLHHAISRGSLETINLLLEAGASCDEENGEGQTAHDLAKHLGYRDVIRVLRTYH